MVVKVILIVLPPAPRQILSAGARLLLRLTPEALIRYFAITVFLRMPSIPFPGRAVVRGAALGKELPPNLTVQPVPRPGHFLILAGLAIFPLIITAPGPMR